MFMYAGAGCASTDVTGEAWLRCKFGFWARLRWTLAIRCRWGHRSSGKVLALLLVRAGSVVPVSDLLDELWGNRPPSSAVINLRSYASGLRRILQDTPAGPVLAKRGAGYLIDLSGVEFDLPRWRQLTNAGPAAMAAGDLPVAAARLGDGLALWRGPALADVPLGPTLAAWQAAI